MSTPSLADRLAVVLQAAGAIIAVVPGATVFMTGAFAPPEHGKSFGAVMAVVGTLAVLMFFLYKERIVNLSPKRANQIILLSVAIGATSLLLYSSARYLCVQPYELVRRADPARPQPVDSLTTRDTVYMPLFLTGELKGYVERAGSRWGAVDRYTPEVIEAAIKKDLGLLLLTTALLLLLYTAMNLSVVVAFMVAGIRAAAPPP